MKRAAAIAIALCLPAGVAAADDTPLAEGTILSVGGGVLDFVSDEMQGISGNGGTWEARVALATRRVASFELTYVGSAQTLDVAGLDPDAWLLGTGAEACVRFTLGHGAVRTLLVVGGGWRRYQLAHHDFNASNMLPEDDVVTVPAGIGLLYREAGFVFELRAVGRAALFSDLTTRSDDRKILDHWTTTAHVGIEL